MNSNSSWIVKNSTLLHSRKGSKLFKSNAVRGLFEMYRWGTLWLYVPSEDESKFVLNHFNYFRKIVGWRQQDRQQDLCYLFLLNVRPSLWKSKYNYDCVTYKATLTFDIPSGKLVLSIDRWGWVYTSSFANFSIWIFDTSVV